MGFSAPTGSTRPSKYEHLYLNEITNGKHLVDEIAAYCDINNRVRPHEALGLTPPIHTYLTEPS